ncbi:hypothetical protein ASPWEDRAFT_26792 [Aspergillus wentii DTO 134E9]|uniref:EKC/KEOPS complex subunit BUD32 n=1 Tax=Aspergillus wentii DTO 134E9 TaxID=1073089 RepID=A0A1L9RR40_ASPWE|nr:uncharacterized protein ASPWEDRAFT_26792 [Aspergillus wentii DTO 134E9]OJJ37399.1 hypothetical protein ASPWEDRAFT_26792 [Aspergillus wentii DTO 134E9]
MVDYYRLWPEWDRSFAFLSHDFLDPNHPKSQEYPYLHYALKTHLDRAMAARNHEEVSRCSHEFYKARTNAYRTDTEDYQTTYDPNPQITYRKNERTVIQTRYVKMCSYVKNNMEIIGLLGGGSYGTVFLACIPSPQADEDENNHDEDQYFAIKIEEVCNLRQHHDYNMMVEMAYMSPEMGALTDQGEVRYIPKEAQVMLFLTGSDRFPALHSVYSDRHFHATIMEAGIDHAIAGVNEDYDRKIPVFTGSYLIHQKIPILNEIEACKVSSQMLEGIRELRNLNLCHCDLSRSNYIIDEELNVRLIDLGMLDFGLKDDHYQRKKFAFVSWHEYQMMPELAAQFMKMDWRRRQRTDTLRPILPHDTRVVELWKFAATTYEILHGFAPWEDPVWDPAIGGDERLIAVGKRRSRMITEEMPVDENLSQDCVDALRIMLARETQQRPKIDDVTSLTWFGQWANHNEVLRRPHVDRYQSQIDNLMYTN